MYISIPLRVRIPREICQMFGRVRYNHLEMIDLAHQFIVPIYSNLGTFKKFQSLFYSSTQNCPFKPYLLNGLLYTITEPSLHVILQGKGKVFIFVQEQVTGRSHQIDIFLLASLLRAPP